MRTPRPIDSAPPATAELKTPVTSIKGFAETLEDGALDDPVAARRFVRIIAGHAKRIAIGVSCTSCVLAAVKPPLLEQAVVNLVDNAIKYSPEGSAVEVALVEAVDEIVIHLPRG